MDSITQPAPESLARQFRDFVRSRAAQDRHDIVRSTLIRAVCLKKFPKRISSWRDVESYLEYDAMLGRMGIAEGRRFWDEFQRQQR
jgi:hypothetical protein